MAHTNDSTGSRSREPLQSSFEQLQQYLDERYGEITREIEMISQSIRERSISWSNKNEKGGRKTKVAKPIGDSRAHHETGHSPLRADSSRTESASPRLLSGATDSRWEWDRTPQVSAAGQLELVERPENARPRCPDGVKKELDYEGVPVLPGQVDQFITIPDTVEGFRRYKVTLEPPERTSTRREFITEPVPAKEVQRKEKYDERAVKQKGTTGENEPSTHERETATDSGLLYKVVEKPSEKNQRSSQTNLSVDIEVKSPRDGDADQTQKVQEEKINATTTKEKPKNRPVIKPDRYDGKTSWPSYLKHFELCADLNGWSNVDKFQFLAVLLSGSAQQVLSTMPKEATGDYTKLVGALKARFDPKEKQELYRAQLRNRRQAPSENLVEMAEEIRRLVDKVYADLPAESRDRMGRDHFLDALAEGDIRIRVIQMRTSTLDGAVAAAVELETLQKAEKERRCGDLKKVNVRQISTGGTAEGNPIPEQAGLQMQMTKMTEQLGKLQNQINRQRPGGNRGPNDRGPRCYQCKEHGHIKPNCPLLRKKEDSQPATSHVTQPQRNNKPENC